MRSKPRSRKYRDLYARRGSVWYERRVSGRPFRVDTETTYTGTLPTKAQWDEAAAFRKRTA